MVFAIYLITVSRCMEGQGDEMDTLAIGLEDHIQMRHKPPGRYTTVRSLSVERIDSGRG
jgi:hypothetical protein